MKTAPKGKLSPTRKPHPTASHDNGSKAPSHIADTNGKIDADDHLAKANKAMQQAWQLISQRKGNKK
jgi:hypothetical protein